MKIEIYEGEMYPVYFWYDGLHEKPWGKVVEIPDELFDKFQRIHEEYHWMQDQLEALHH